ncbi:unnamed protein product, partial [Meganyctiphanes norvegica]
TKIPEVPRDPQLIKVLHGAFQLEIFHPTYCDWQQAITNLNSAKPPKLISMKEIYDDMDKALTTNVRQNFDDLVKSIVQQLTYKMCSDQGTIELTDLRRMRKRDINKLTSKPVRSEVENLVDYECPP